MLSCRLPDHINVFPTFPQYVETFRKFVDSIETIGSFIYYTGDENLRRIANGARADIKCIPYDAYDGEVPMQVFGQHNMQNLQAAMLACHCIGVAPDDFYREISTFTGASNRLEKICETETSVAYKDFAHSPSKLKATINAVRERYPEKKLIAAMELHTFSSLVTSLDYNSYVGRIAIGRVHRGELKDGQTVTLAKKDGTMVKTKIKELHTFSGMGHVKTDVVKNGDICALIGIEGFEIGDTICDAENPEPLKPIAIDEPTMSMTFCINDSPFFGQDGKFVTSRHIQDRLNKELEKNLALRVEKGAEESSWRVFGRGVLHLSVLIETMRREGYELQVGQPQVIVKEIDGVKCEPVEMLTVNTPEECSGKIIEFVSTHKGEMTKMEIVNDRVHLEFTIPSRGIMGMRTYVMNVSAGEAIMAHRFLEYQPWKGEIVKRNNGSLIAMEAGTAYAYALDKLQEVCRFCRFITWLSIWIWWDKRGNTFWQAIMRVGWTA